MRWEQLMSVSRRQAEPKTRAAAQDNTMRRRLGRTSLGRHAHEDSMPDWLAALLRTKGEIKTEGVVPVLKQLLEQSKTTQYAYLCHESVHHFSKLKLEGGFCGYRNIQMLISYIIATGFKGQEHFKGRLPTIFEIQDIIENAWDRGINVQGRIETGGIRGTRKYIGTAEELGNTVSNPDILTALANRSKAVLPKPSQTRKLASRKLAF
ncbi:hypothetical protein BN1708_014414 [Verticillium longisporum]|uniref:UFSP1/2/DUB catalytic domain-containing protein n=1 Tax=Verticillium longisporum TaxID=100787 RepID=A0A0G4LVW8_VERLO|nr:hypothetical protein BN1708_014414 [Verticillium longisporum]